MFNAFWWLHFGLNHGGLKIKSQYHNVGNKEKGRISKRDFQKNKASQIFKKTNVSYHLIRTRMCACQEIRNVRFLENLCVLCFLERPVLRFALFPLLPTINSRGLGTIILFLKGLGLVRRKQ